MKNNYLKLITRIMISYIKHLTIIVLALSVLGCKGKSGENENENVSNAKTEFTPERNLVDTMVLRAVDFNREIISNGHLKATKRAELRFKSQGEIELVFVKNGSRIATGAPIAKLNEENLKIKMEQAIYNMEKAELDLKDNLIGFGQGSDTSKISKEILRISKMKSGYTIAMQNYNSAKKDLMNATLRAPFSGIIANLNLKPYETIPSTAACMVIDDSSFDVYFYVLESELAYIKEGLTINVAPYTNLQQRFSGVIKEINPLVDEQGQIKVVASIKNFKNMLIDGMNVKVFIENTIKNQLSVPKSAVVIRDGYDVVFTVNLQTNRVNWVYVDVIASNSTNHIIKGSEFKNTIINAGEIIVTSGNLNLADNSKIEIKSSQTQL
jgi:RND family efflux transporter, MFP subunit